MDVSENGLPRVVRERISGLSDEELMQMLGGNPAEYTPEAWDFAKQELMKRGREDLIRKTIVDAEKTRDRSMTSKGPGDPRLARSAKHGFAIGAILGLFGLIIIFVQLANSFPSKLANIGVGAAFFALGTLLCFFSRRDYLRSMRCKRIEDLKASDFPGVTPKLFNSWHRMAIANQKNFTFRRWIIAILGAAGISFRPLYIKITCLFFIVLAWIDWLVAFFRTQALMREAGLTFKRINHARRNMSPAQDNEHVKVQQ